MLIHIVGYVALPANFCLLIKLDSVVVSITFPIANLLAAHKNFLDETRSAFNFKILSPDQEDGPKAVPIAIFELIGSVLAVRRFVVRCFVHDFCLNSLSFSNRM